ncbi:ATP-binding cassette domain-containing protein, partial [Candidatus Aerophobetes bacterium]|nr:ATP-binding cassette domain-containing protein [Candidatus Aerophobetes bacterium]
AGKTTTIRMLTGLSTPTEGEASVLGFDINSEITRAKRYVGVVPETSNLYDELSCLDNLLFMGALYGVSRSERKKRAKDLLKTFGLDKRKDDLFRTLSRGMKRALTITSSLIHQPRLLFLDEPTVGLDAIAARSVRNLIRSFHQEGLTIFLTTHYLEEADLLCDRIAILVKGKIIKTDTPQALKNLTEKESVIEFEFAQKISEFLQDISTILHYAQVVPINDRKIRIYGGLPSEIYSEIVTFAKNKGIEIRVIQSIRTTLEDAFIKITGLSPAIMATEKGKR